MGFINILKKDFKNLLNNKVGFNVIGGQHNLPKSKDHSTYLLEFADYTTKNSFLVHVEPSYKDGMLGIKNYKEANPYEIGIKQ